MLHIHTSNRLEYLIQALATVIKANPLPPLTQETIVVQSKGMERWVSMELAKQLGVWANGYFPFANAMLWRLFKETLGYLPDTSLFEREVMVWSLMDILPEFLENPEFTEIHNYLQGDEQHIKHFQLASRIADIFDQYLMYRPTWIGDWENGVQPRELENDSQARWQAILWRALVKRYGTQHRAKLRADFFRNVQRLADNPRIAQRVSVFGISALPPFHLEVLAELGQVIEVSIFLLNPCQEYWGDILSDSEIAHVEGGFRTHDELYFEKGNSLLASMGKMGRDFIDIINEYPHNPHEYFDNDNLDETKLLHCIQSDILHLRERGEDKNNQITMIDADDKSLQIHACHSPMREVEVLHDQLLALFEENPALLPNEVLVMMPDIETYAPFIEAVFDTIPDEAKRIPFSIADRSLRDKSALIDTFFAILELSNSRFSATQVLAVLDAEAVQKRFGLNEQDLDLIRHWIDKTGIRWGMDKAHRERQNLPAFEENTWRAGLNRLLLGYALPQSPRVLFQCILPFDEIEGSDTLILGKLVAFIENLFKCVQKLEQPRTLTKWSDFLIEVLDDFLSPDENSEAEAQQVRNVLNSLVENSNRSGFDAQVSRDVMLAYLRQYLENEPLPSNFLTGYMSFCAMLPMRTIPFKVICLLGMNDQAYPRPNKPLGFDLIAKNPQRGDRSRRQNDRYLFLEALLSAREYFYISYVGQSIHDNTVIPPSVLVSELLDYIDKGFTHPMDSLVTHHPLQAFSPRYFNGTDKRLFSFSGEYCTASTALQNERRDTKTFMTKPLPEPQAEWKTVDINRLTRFFKNPTEFLLKERLGIALQASKSLLNESEPFEVQGLDLYALKQTLVEKSLEGMELQEYQAIAKASGQLPHGKIGDIVYSQLTGQIQTFVKRVQKVTQQDKREAIAINMKIGDMHITGRLGKLWYQHLVHYRCAKLKVKDYIKLWIHHLILNSHAHKDLPRHSLLIGENEGWEYQPVNNSEAILQTLLDLYWQGLVQPLHFFPESSLTFVESQIKKGKTEQEAFYSALDIWRGHSKARGEAEDDYYRLCFGRADESTPLENEPFKILAKAFFEPLLAHRQMLKS
jgi:exodeoxyribonuclease V gamma subunit